MLAEFAMTLFKQILEFVATDEAAPTDRDLRAAAADVLNPDTPRARIIENGIPPPVRPRE